MSEAIKAAMAAAAQVSQAQTQLNQVPATTAEVHHLPAAPVRPGTKLSMKDMQGGALSVDQWIKVKEDGLKIGDNQGLIETLTVSIEMTDGRGFVPKLAIKAGNPAQYFYTVDGVVAAGGGSWESACNRARTIDPKAREYRCVDLPMRLEQNVTVKGKEAVKSGTLLGYTTSTTNWANWEKFYGIVEEAGLMGQRVLVKIGAQARSNKSGNTWGVMTFELIGAAEEEGDE